MGMVHALQKGDISPDSVSSKVKKAAGSMTKKSAKKYASTKHTNLPVKKESVMNIDALRSRVIDKLKETIRTEVMSTLEEDVVDSTDAPNPGNSLDETNTLFAMDKETRKFAALKGGRSDNENIKELQQLIQKHMDMMVDVEAKFTALVKKHLPKKGSSMEYTFIHQLKSPSSIINKVIMRNRPLIDIGDLVRGAVLFKNHADMDAFIKAFRRKESSIITDYDYKAKGGDPTFGYYGSHHFDLNIGGFPTELQVMPMKLWNYKDGPGGAHTIYDKWRTNPSKMPKIDQQLSKKLFNMGNMQEVSQLSEEKVQEVLDNLLK